MPVFDFTVIDAEGRRRNGTIDAPDRTQALDRLRGEGYTPLSVEPLKEAKNVEDILARFRDVSLTTLVYFSRQLATMINAGISPLRSLEVLAEQEENPKFREIIVDVIRRIENGEAMNRAFSEHPETFDNLYVAMLRAGEESGNLANSLAELATQLEKKAHLQRTIKSATTYPKVVMCFAFVIVSGLVMFLVPRFANLFKQTIQETQIPNAKTGKLPSAALPGPTQFLENLSYLMYPPGDRGSLGYWFFSVSPFHIGVALRVILLVALIIGIRKLTKRVLLEPGPRAQWDGFKLKFPMRIGPLIQKIAVARFSRTFASLLRAGVPAQEAMDIVADSSGNVLIANAVREARERMLAGSTIAEPLARSGTFPVMVTRMIQIGEETGQLEAMLVKVAEFFEDEVDLALRSLTSIIEPLMIIIVGSAIGVIIISIYLPMFDLYNKVGTGVIIAPYLINQLKAIRGNWREYKHAIR